MNPPQRAFRHQGNPNGCCPPCTNAPLPICLSVQLCYLPCHHGNAIWQALHLDLTDNQVSDVGTEALASSLKSSAALESLDLQLASNALGLPSPYPNQEFVLGPS